MHNLLIVGNASVMSLTILFIKMMQSALFIDQESKIKNYLTLGSYSVLS